LLELSGGTDENLLGEKRIAPCRAGRSRPIPRGPEGAQREDLVNRPLPANSAARRDRQAPALRVPQPHPAGGEKIGDVLLSAKLPVSHPGSDPGRTWSGKGAPAAAKDQGADIRKTRDPALGKEEANGQVKIRPRRPHQGGDCLPFDSELEGLFG